MQASRSSDNRHRGGGDANINVAQNARDSAVGIPAATAAADTTQRLISPQRDLTVALLRRSSSRVTPTRTLRLTEQEHEQQQQQQQQQQTRRQAIAASPTNRITLESLQARPRSNQRNRTPRRNDESSSLDPNQFRRPDNRHDNFGETNATSTAAAPRITIRPGAGRAVGTSTGPMRIREEIRRERSAKQGPSHRKVRRWNNDHFDKLAAEIKGKAAEVLLRGKEQAHLYRAIYDPAEHQSKAMNRFLEDRKLESVRGHFFNGEGPPAETMAMRNSKRAPSPTVLTGQDMLLRIDNRLRRVVTKACHNSYPASRVVKTMETFLLNTFGDNGDGKMVPNNMELADDWWTTLLLECPTVTTRKDDGLLTVQFYFDPTNATGGFHRLLLHAVCQFHGLSAVSRMVEIAIGSHTQSRALTVTGQPTEKCGGNNSGFTLSQVLTADDEDDPAVETLGTKLEDSWTMV